MSNNDARHRILPQSETSMADKFEVIDGNNRKWPPTPPASSVSVSRGNREAIISAFQHHQVSIVTLASRQQRKRLVIEGVIRDRLDELDGRVRSLQALRLHLTVPMKRVA